MVLGFKDRLIQKNNLHVCHNKGTKLEKKNSFTNFFLINQLCLSTGIKKNPICEKDCMKIKLNELHGNRFMMTLLNVRPDDCE